MEISAASENTSQVTGKWRCMKEQTPQQKYTSQRWVRFRGIPNWKKNNNAGKWSTIFNQVSRFRPPRRCPVCLCSNFRFPAFVLSSCGLLGNFSPTRRQKKRWAPCSKWGLPAVLDKNAQDQPEHNGTCRLQTAAFVFNICSTWAGFFTSWNARSSVLR